MTSSAGYPFDKTYYQAVKGMVGALDVLEPGGDLIIVSACSEGIGSPDYAEAQMCLANAGPEGFLRGILDKKYAAIELAGYLTTVISNELSGEASVVAAELARRAIAFKKASNPGDKACLIAGGETTVTVRGNGKGGR